VTGDLDDPEGYLARRVLDALLREDYGGLTRHVVLPGAGRAPDAVGSAAVGEPGAALRLPGSGRTVRLRPDGFLADLRVDDAEDLRLDEVLAALRSLADSRDDVPGFVRECRETLATLHLHAAHRDEVFRRLAPPTTPPATDACSATYYDVLAGYLDHPVYPAARCRLGLGEEELHGYAPEFAPAFRMRWAVMPRDRVTAAGTRPGWWPSAADVGLPASAMSGRDLLPVHPLTARILEQCPDGPELAPEPYLEVAPTLSMRTVAVIADPATHVKVPLPTSTLGRRNRRTIQPGTLHDGALVQRVLAAVMAHAPGGPPPVWLADEQTYGHAGDPLLGYLVRRLPVHPVGVRVVPVAALLAPTPAGTYVIEELTGDGDVAGFFGGYLRALFGWHVALFGAGIALEAHQQNVSAVLPLGGDPRRPRLLVKDNDGALLDPAALERAGLGSVLLDEVHKVRDRRMLTSDREALARVFVTITLHLCAGALAFGLAERGLLPLPAGLALIRARLAEAIDEHDQPFLRARTLDAGRLPVKAMVTAGTLVDKARTGARDINKHYGPPGPNYLRDAPVKEDVKEDPCR
jgi:siderophore synthetase component